MVRTRIAPSPTGFPHIGTVYQAMLDRAYALKHQGQFFIRIEDTDKARFVEGAESKIYEALDWFNLREDVSPRFPDKLGPYKQSERLAIYQKYAQELVEKKHAYYCFCSKERLDEVRKQRQLEGKPPLYDQHCRHLDQTTVQVHLAKKDSYVIRMVIPQNQTIKVNDLIRGELEFDSNLIDDQVILKSDGFPTYHLAVVIDDHLMKTTHIVRGPEWLPSSPKHKLLYDYLELDMPILIHTPMITNMDGSKMSKRHGHANVGWYQEEGLLPEAILNFLALMGWSHPEGKEVFSYLEFISVFDFKDLNPISPKFDHVKLEWLNGEYIRALNPKELAERIKEYYRQYKKQDFDSKKLEQTIPLVQTRMKKLSDYWALAGFIFSQPEKVELSLNILKQEKKELFMLLEQTAWTHANLYKRIEQFAIERAIKPIKLYMELRAALANQKVTTPLFESLEIIGKEKTIARLKQVLN